MPSTLEEASAKSVPLSISVRWFFDSAVCVIKGKLLGRVLTIIDASIADPQQRKALKDIVKDAFSSTHDLEREIGDYAKDSAAVACGDEDREMGVLCSSNLKDIAPIHTEGYKYTRSTL